MYKILILCGALLILLPFIMQYAIEQNNHKYITTFENIVDEAKEEASASGCFTPQIIANMKADIIDKLGIIDESDIIINTTGTLKYKRNSFSQDDMIEYEIGIPIKRLVAANKFWGVSDEDNSTIYYIRGLIRSEVLAP